MTITLLQQALKKNILLYQGWIEFKINVIVYLNGCLYSSPACPHVFIDMNPNTIDFMKTF